MSAVTPYNYNCVSAGSVVGGGVGTAVDDGDAGGRRGSGGGPAGAHLPAIGHERVGGNLPPDREERKDGNGDGTER